MSPNRQRRRLGESQGMGELASGRNELGGPGEEQLHGLLLLRREPIPLRVALHLIFGGAGRVAEAEPSLEDVITFGLLIGFRRGHVDSCVH